MDLTKYALLTFLIGLIILFFLSQNLEPKLIKISEINKKMLDNYVKIQGDIIKIKNYDTLTIMTINDSTETINIITSKTNITKGKIEVIGKVKEYRGILEIEAEKIIKLL
ncbi:MAG: hypothetical protein QW041_01135 [Candidatus Pacearchaeota archaeon]